MKPSHDPEELLREGPWLRRLARALVRDEGLAEDLSQEVLAAALVARRPRGGPRLRAWLGSVARNAARRRLRRDALRATVEENATRPESSEVDPCARLAAQEAVARALARVAEPYRSAVVLRYFDDLAPREVADRLGLSQEAARQRISRGVARLRAELEREHGQDARLWSAVLVPLARLDLHPLRAAVRAAPSPTLLMSTKHIAAAALAVVLVAVTYVGVNHERTSRATAAGATAGPARTDGASQRGTFADVQRSSGAGERALQPSSPTAPPAQALVRVVGPDGSPIAGARAAWVAASGSVAKIELDDEGTAPRPSGAAQGLFATAPELPITWLDLADGAEAHVRLDPGQRALGTVIEDGGPPSSPVGVATDITAPIELPRRTARELRALGFTFGRIATKTQGSGSFSLGPLPTRWTGSLEPASTHGFTPGVTAAERQADGTWLLWLVRRPAIRGRFVVAETGEAAVGRFALDFKKPGIVAPHVEGLSDEIRRLLGEDAVGQFAGDASMAGTESLVVEDWTDEAGRFEFGLPSLRDGERPSSVTIHGTKFASAPLGGHLALELDGLVFPYDVGTIEVERGETLVLEVRSSHGDPVPAAHVAGPKGTATTGAHGRATLTAAPGDAVEVLAAGYRVARVKVRDRASGPGAVQVVELEPGTMLRITPLADRIQHVLVEWDESPFAIPADEVSPPGVYDSYQEGSPMRGWNLHESAAPGFLYLAVPPFGDVEVPGLAFGSRLRVIGLDAALQPCVEVPVQLPAIGSDALHVDLTAPDRRTAVVQPTGELVIEARSIDGAPVPIRSVHIRPIAEGPQKVSASMKFSIENHPDRFSEGRFELWPLCNGELHLEVTTEDGRTQALPNHLFTGERDLLELVF